MAEYPNIADFSSKGFNIGNEQKVLAYLHGLSDFWVYMFDDASKINMMMEANALGASDIYNKFLQLTSVISLEDITALTNVQMKLILITDEDNNGISNPGSGKVAGAVETYYLPKDSPIKHCRYLANRAFLPTALLENGADYFIDPDAGTISFARPLADIGFAFRNNLGHREWAIWAIDAKVDDQLIYKHYAKLINIDPTTSSDSFKQFVYGMYYLFVNGPNLETIKQGLNIALGIPLARDTGEIVLQIRRYLNTDQWLVITDQNSYLIPYGLEPSVAVDDTLITGQQIADWIEVKDWVNDGEWWINYMIPSHLMPHIPLEVPGGDGVIGDGTPDRYMTAGSYADWIMRNYLKKHTFLVNVKTVNFKNLQTFEQLFDIIHEVKPIWTAPVYVWSIPVEEKLEINDKTFSKRTSVTPAIDITEGVESFTRNQSVPFDRGGPRWIRMSVPAKVKDQTGYNPDINGYPRQVFLPGSVTGGIVNGFISACRGLRDFTTEERAWDTTLRTRDSDQYVASRSWMAYKRDGVSTGAGEWENPIHRLHPGKRLVYLYTTVKPDLKEKLATLGLPTLGMGYMTNVLVNQESKVIANWNYLMTKSTNAAYLGGLASVDNYVTYQPAPGDYKTGDYLVFVASTSDMYIVYWATSNFSLQTMPFVAHEANDPMEIIMEGAMTRGQALQGSPYYALRGSLVISYNSSDAINEKAFNEEQNTGTSSEISYADAYNAQFISDRSGQPLKTRRVWQ